MDEIDQGARRLLHVGKSIGASDLDIGPILADKAAKAAASALGAQGGQVQAQFQLLTQRLQGSTSLEQTKKLLLQQTSMASGVARAVDLAQQAGQLQPGLSQFLERLTPNRASLAEVASRELGGLLQGADVARARRAYDAAGSVLGWASGSLPPEIANLLPAQYAQVGAELTRAVHNGTDLLKPLKQYGALLKKDAQRELASLQLKFDEKKPAELAKLSAAELKAPSIGEGIKAFRSGASTLYSALRMVGANAEAQAVAQMAGYAESAAKVLQTVQLLSTAVTGVGSLAAIGQLMGGVGALGFFGGGAAAGNQDPGQKEVLAALSTLNETIKTQFQQVNTKLDFIIGMLGDLVSSLANVNLTLADIHAQVKRIEGKVDLVLIRQSQATLLQASMHKDSRHALCMHQLENLDARDIKECRVLYSLVASQLTTNPWQTPAKTLPDAHNILANAFPADVSTRGSDVEIWPTASALAKVLKEELGVVVPGVPAYEPALWECLDSYAAWRIAMPAAFNALVGTREQVQKIRTVADNHETFITALRDDRSGSLIDQFSTRYVKALNELASEMKIARRAVFDKEIEKLSAGTTGYFNSGEVSLTSSAPSGAPTLTSVLKADDFKATGGVSFLFNSGINVQHQVERMPPRPLEIEALYYRTTNRAQVPGFQFWDDEAEVVADIMLHGQLVLRHTIKLKLRFTRSKEHIGHFMQVPQADPLRYLELAEDQSNARGQVRASIIDALQSEAAIRSVKNLHFAVLENSGTYGDDLFRAQLAQSSEFGNGSGSLRSLAKLDELATILRQISELACAEASAQSNAVQAFLYGEESRRLVDRAVAMNWALAKTVDEPLPQMARKRWVAFRNAWSRMRVAVVDKGAPFSFTRAKNAFDTAFPESEFPRI